MDDSKSTYILCLESSSSICSVALSKDGEVLATKDATEGQKHSKWMTVFIETLLAEAKISLNQLSAIAVSSGPGSYTGLRVAYSIAKGIGYSLSIPIIEVPTLEALGNSFTLADANNSYCIISALDARRMEVYWRITNNLGECMVETEAHIYSETSFDPFLGYDKIYVVGDGAEKINELDLDKEVLDKIQIFKHFTFASNLSSLAYSKFLKNEFADIAYCTPFYLKSPRITTSKKVI